MATANRTASAPDREGQIMAGLVKCPYCGGDPYECVDIGVGTQAVALSGCCEDGLEYFDPNHEPTEAQQGLIPIPDGYAES